MSLSLRAIVFYKRKSLPHFGKLMQSNEVVTLRKGKDAIQDVWMDYCAPHGGMNDCTRRTAG